MRRIINAAAVVAALGVSAAAGAQSQRTLDVTAYGVSVRAGVALPLDSTLTDLAPTLIALGIEYQLNRPLLRGGETYFALDYWAKNLRFEKGTVLPLTINQRVYLNNESLRRNYYFFGLGVAFINVTSSDTAIAVRGGFGTELGPNTFAEIGGTLSDRAGGARANALTLQIGYRF